MMFPCAARIWTVLMCRLRVVPVWSERTATLCRGQAFSSFGNKAFTASTTAMTFVPGCFEHENDGKGPVLPAGEFRVLRLLHNGRDVRKPDRGTVLLGHDQTLVVLGRLELIVVVDR